MHKKSEAIKKNTANMRMTGDHTPTVIREFPSTSRHIHADRQSCSLIQSLQYPYVQLH